MEFTTLFGLHFQTTRLREETELHIDRHQGPDTRYGKGLDQKNVGSRQFSMETSVRYISTCSKNIRI